MCDDNRSATLDAGNVKLTYNSLLEKAESKEKERMKEENRKLRKLETNFRTMLAKLPIEPSTPWETARPQLEKESEFEAIPHEYERARIYKEYMKDLEESCSHSHNKRKVSEIYKLFHFTAVHKSKQTNIPLKLIIFVICKSGKLCWEVSLINSTNNRQN